MKIKVGEAITYEPSKYHYEHYVNSEKVTDKIVMKTNGYFNLGVPIKKKLEVKVTEKHIKEGRPGEMCECPISLALEETYEQLMPEGAVVKSFVDTFSATIKVASSSAEMDDEDWYPTEDGKQKYTAKSFIFSDTLNNWITRYDNKGTAEPIEFVSVESDDYDNNYLVETSEYMKCVDDGVPFNFTILEGETP